MSIGIVNIMDERAEAEKREAEEMKKITKRESNV